MEIKTYYGDERDKGYELAIDLLIHGVSKKQIMDVLGISKKLLYSWRRNADIVLIETFERYNTEEEYEKKFRELKKYKDFYTIGARIDNEEEKRLKAKQLFEKGFSNHKVSNIVHISKYTADKWRKEMGFEYIKDKTSYQTDAWVAEWCKEWDDFMKQLKRPLMIKSKE